MCIKYIFLLWIMMKICQCEQLNQIQDDKQHLTLDYHEVDTEEILDHIAEEERSYQQDDIDDDGVEFCSSNSKDCHPSRKCNMFCNCNIEMNDGYIYNMAVVSDFVFTITQQSF
eukprot:810915_1